MATRSPALLPEMETTPLLSSFYPTSITYPPTAFLRQDESPDSQWYSQPRFVQHIDDGAITTLKSYYSTIIQRKHSILDVYSLWASHLPSSLKPSIMIGIGMNAPELSRNSHLTKHFVKELNTKPEFSEIEDESIVVVICNASVDYLTKPIKVFDEMRRVLKMGGTAHMSFSNRCFPTKVKPWIRISDKDTRRWEDAEEVVLKEGNSGVWGIGEDPLFVVRAKKASSK